MKSRVFTFISLFSLVVALVAASSAFAQTTPGESVYKPNSGVLDVVQGGGSDTSPNSTPHNGTAPDICAAANGRDANGNAVTYGSAADCATTSSVCAAANGRDANGNAVAYGSAADCATTVAHVSGGSLPFTGFQAGLVALAGAALLGTGFAMRRVARRQPTA